MKTLLLSTVAALALGGVANATDLACSTPQFLVGQESKDPQDAVGAPHVGERTEKQLIAAFCDKIAELSPQLVTFNGNSFDLPVLRYRAMVHGISAPGLSTRPYFHRYTEDAIDLCDALSSFSSQSKATLHEISRVMGLPGKPRGFDGSEVERYFREAVTPPLL